MKMQPYPDLSEGACVGVPVDMFYPGTVEEPDSPAYQEKDLAKRICGTCPVREACLTWALHHEQYGIWGGTDAGTRRMMRRKLGITLYDPIAETPAK